MLSNPLHANPYPVLLLGRVFPAPPSIEYGGLVKWVCIANFAESPFFVTCYFWRFWHQAILTLSKLTPTYILFFSSCFVWRISNCLISYLWKCR